MGYYIEQKDSSFIIRKENFNKALNALKSVFIPENMNCKDYIHGVEIPHFSWVDTETVLKASSLKDALIEIRYEPKYDDDENIVDVEFLGEKAGCEEIFFKALAPYIENESYISFKGEDDCEWIWRFNDKEAECIYI